jgi:ABC-type molybdate transport system substrate-binding protein
MSKLFKLLGRAGVVAAMALAPLGAHAVCTTIGSTGTVGFKMAVASNFYLSTQAIATSFLAVGPKDYDIEICEGSSGNLFTEITANSNAPQYAIFLSADQQRPADLRQYYYSLTLSAPYTYAKGIPVFILSPDAYATSKASTSKASKSKTSRLETYRAVDYLTTGITGETPPGATAQRSDASLPVIDNYVKLHLQPDEPTVDYLGIGNPGLAPYGDQAAKILGRPGSVTPPVPAPPANNMGQWADPRNAATDVSSACSTFTGTSYICEYDNINLTLDAINNNAVTAGFVSYGQVCPELATDPSYPVDRYVLFKDYPTMQDGIQLAVTDSDAASRAANFITYMFDGAGSANWNTWLTDHCYDAVLATAKGGKAAKGDKADKRPAR